MEYSDAQDVIQIEGRGTRITCRLIVICVVRNGSTTAGTPTSSPQKGGVWCMVATWLAWFSAAAAPTMGGVVDEGISPGAYTQLDLNPTRKPNALLCLAPAIALNSNRPEPCGGMHFDVEQHALSCRC